MIIEQVALWGSIIGSLILALHVPWAAWAYLPFLCSNAATLYLLGKSTAPRVLTWQVWFFIAINAIGIYCWIV